MNPPTITWVNHASFLLEHGDIAILADPWLKGTAFDDGWAHTTATVIPDLKSVSHIWISHEHPDHFSPASLKLVPEDRRRGIELLFQPTRDRRLAKFCASMGFTVRETDEPLMLSDEVEVQILPWSSGDSILRVTAGGRTLLNLNDAMISSISAVESIRDATSIKHLDVLMTQFSYANWVGNPDQVDLRRRAAAEKLERMRMQVRALEPDFVIPFASHIWFCHEENFYLNEGIAKASDAVAAVRGLSKAVMLYPGDTWTIGSPLDAGVAAARYDHDLRQRLEEGPLVKSDEPVEFEVLQKFAVTYVAELAEENGRIAQFLLRRLGFIRDLKVHLTDLDIDVELSRGGLSRAALIGPADVALSSSAFAFVLKNRFGGATLNVNGRFIIPESASPRTFSRHGSLRDLNNRDETVVDWLRWKMRSARWLASDKLRSLLRRGSGT